jgi:hypothetical protein
MLRCDFLVSFPNFLFHLVNSYCRYCTAEKKEKREKDREWQKKKKERERQMYHLRWGLYKLNAVDP